MAKKPAKKAAKKATKKTVVKKVVAAPPGKGEDTEPSFHELRKAGKA